MRHEALRDTRTERGRQSHGTSGHSYRDALQKPNYNDRWLPAMKKQDDSLRDKEVYELFDKTKDMNFLPSKWVYERPSFEHGLRPCEAECARTGVGLAAEQCILHESKSPRIWQNQAHQDSVCCQWPNRGPLEFRRARLSLSLS